MSAAITNPLDMKCPKQKCQSKVIRKNAATLVYRQPRISLPGIGETNTDMQGQTSDVPEEVASLLPADTATMDGWFWMLTDIFQFENVGFSHVDRGQKYLSCADCDLAPLGYHDTTVSDAGEKEYLVAINRVAYIK
ncbi:hypothetical protein J3B02_000870 [Coemansia erecta]|uniref:Mss4-like protein n=1 Tax=Coemansia asiatica TaxID=1052880 RepID=A0A9W8CKE6_9FUNG|nr:hypothetical protein LPJ64_002561 [Coemansia asiatica]KAJ2857622.1 hypothetical protein J3B02_000870 [Coemansia erecta]KAJ2879853.1 hypothetical protein FB639_002979 [Coemansia asiatica]